MSKFFWTLVCFVGLTVPLAAQNRATGEIRGTIRDSSGAVMPDVRIVFRETATLVTKESQSDDVGSYVFPYLPPGTYDLNVTQSGFRGWTQTGIGVHAGDVIQVNPVLTIGQVSEAVTVTASAAHLEQESAERATRLTNSSLTELPVVGRDNQQLWILVPGASYGDQRAMGGGPGGDRVSVSGQRPFSANYIVDGGTAVFGQSNNSDRTRPSFDATEEVNISTNNMSAEYGSGVVVFSVVTKSGTNSLHGGAYEFMQNTDLGARGFFDPSRNPRHWNMPGAFLGGPIKSDKTFFFFSYEATRAGTPGGSLNTMPTPAMLQGDFSAPGLPTIFDPGTTSTVNGQATRQPFAGNVIPKSRLDPVASALSTYWPTPNRSGFANNYYFPSFNRTDSDKYNAKLDHNFSAANRLTASLLMNNYRVKYSGPMPGPACLGGNCGGLADPNWASTISDVWTVKPTLLNELRLSFLRANVLLEGDSAGMDIPSKIGLKNVPDDQMPLIKVSGFLGTSLQPGNSYHLRQNAFAEADTLTWIHGRHIVKMGGEFQKRQVNNAQPMLDSGTFGFTGVFSRNPASNGSALGLADFMLGLPQTYSLNPAPDLGERMWNMQAFIQDDFKIRSNITLNLGVRWGAHSGWSEVNNRLSDFDPTISNPVSNSLGGIWYAGQNGRTALTQQRNALMAPRLGIAWSPTSKTSVRAGYGIFYLPWMGVYLNQNPVGFGINQSAQSTDQLTPIFSLQNGPPMYSLPNPANRTAGALNGSSLTYWPYNVKDSYSQQWHVSIQQQLTPTTIVEASYIGTKGSDLLFPRDLNQVPASSLGPGNMQPYRPYPQFQSITSILDDASSIYQALQFTVRKAAAKGLTVSASYTLSKIMDNSSCDPTTYSGNLYQISASPNLSRAVGQTDIPQIMSGYVVYELPFGKNRTWLNRGGLLNAVLGGWQTTAVVQAQSGIPFTPTMAGANLSGSLAGTWLPNRIGSGALTSGQPGINNWFNTSDFVAPQLYTFGNSGRDILRGPGFVNLDLGLNKSFQVIPSREKLKLQLRADFSNALNHANFDPPDATIGSSTAGQISGASDPRNIQVGLKILF